MALLKRSEIFSRFSKPLPALDEEVEVNFFRNPIGINELTFVNETPVIPVHLDLEFLARDITPLGRIEIPQNDLEIIGAYEDFISERNSYISRASYLGQQVMELPGKLQSYQEELKEAEEDLVKSENDEERKFFETRVRDLRSELRLVRRKYEEVSDQFDDAQSKVDNLIPPVEDIEERYNRVIESNNVLIEDYKKRYGEQADRSVRMGILPFSTRVYNGTDDRPLNDPSMVHVPEEIMMRCATKWAKGELIPYRVHVDMPGLKYGNFKGNFLPQLIDSGYVMREGILSYSREGAPYTVEMIINNKPEGPNNAVLDVKGVDKLGGSDLGRVMLWMKAIKERVE